MTLAEIWYLAIAILWIGFFVLEGFDFGVGMLLRILGKEERERRVIINTIGPVWDGNEVWLLTAAGAMFAAFPEWYATVFSGLYAAFFFILLGLIVRGVSFEYRHKRNLDSWRTMFDTFIIFGSTVVPLLLGLGIANLVRGLPIIHEPNSRNWVMDASSVLGLLTPFALLGAITFLAVFIFHGGIYISLKTRGDLHVKAQRLGLKVGVLAIVLQAAYAIWMAAAYGKGLVSWIIAIVTIAALAFAYLMNAREREGWAFVGTIVSIISMGVAHFVSLWPNVIPALTPGNDMSIQDAASTSYTLTIMTVATGIFLPMVLAYQAWTFWVFRKRISTKNIPYEMEGVH